MEKMVTYQPHFLKVVGDNISEKLQTNSFKPLASDERFLLASMHLQRAEWHDRGLEPLAILPVETWNKLCYRFNLYRFEHFNADGSVPCYNFSYGTGLIHIALAWYAFNWFLDLFYHFMGLSGLMPYFMVGAACTYGISRLKEETFVSYIFLMIVPFYTLIELYNHYFNKVGLIDFFPHKCSTTTMNDRETYGTIKLKFPNAPGEVKQLQSKLQNWKIKDSIAADEYSVTILEKSFLSAIARNDDPILYVVHPGRGLVSVLAQWGEFPAEKELIDYVQKLTTEDILNDYKNKKISTSTPVNFA